MPLAEVVAWIFKTGDDPELVLQSSSGDSLLISKETAASWKGADLDRPYLVFHVGKTFEKIAAAIEAARARKA